MMKKHFHAVNDPNQVEKGQVGLVSVIIPAYNAHATIERCVDSVLHQSYSETEVIIVDDGSTDETPILVDTLASNNPKVQAIHQNNRGLSGARNAGLDVASGEYVFFLDSDDYIEQDEIKTLYEEMTKCGAEIVIGGLVYESPEGVREKEINAGRAIMNEESFWHHAYLESPEDYVEYVVSCGKLFKRTVFHRERFDEGKLHEDEFIIQRLVSKCGSISFADVAGYIYVQHNGSITHNPSVRSCLDGAEALLIRTNYFMDKKWVNLAWITLKVSRRLLANSIYEKGSIFEQSRRKRLIASWKETFRVLKSKDVGDLRDRITCLIFRISPRFFLLLAGDGRQQ